jgi:hypothetical protein
VAVVTAPERLFCSRPGKQALTSLTNLPLAGHAGIAAARRFHAASQIATANDHEVLNGFGRRPASCPAMRPAVTVG